VAGYAIEYGSTPYMLFYLAEMSNILLMSGLMAILFLGAGRRRSDALHGPLGADGGQPLRLHVAVSEGAVRLLHERHGPLHRAALPLRPADAPGLEGVPADLTGRRGPGGRLAGLHGLGA